MSARAALAPWFRPLRIWQHAALAKWARSRPAQSLAVVTPGGGKTLYACAVAYGALVDGLIDDVLVVVPSDHLRTQAAIAFAEVGIELDPTFATSTPTIARDLYGAVVTYHQVANAPEVFRELAGGSPRRPRRVLVVMDEVHHAGDHESWGASVRRAFSAATYILALSGTPFRSDETPVAFLDYDTDGRVVSDTVYGYREALRDGIVRPLVFYREGGSVEFTDRDGGREHYDFNALLNADGQRRRLRAALRDKRWLTTVLERAHRVLESLHRHDPDAAGLIVAVNERHARWIANLMQQALGIYPVVVTYNDAAAGDKIVQFRNGRAPWLIAVRMVSEGVDIPRARVLVYATTILTQMFFVQMIGRVVRVRDEHVVPAFVFLPDDPTLRAWAESIEADVHSVRRVSEEAAWVALPEVAMPSLPSPARFEQDDEYTENAALHEAVGEIVGDVSAEVIREPPRPRVEVVRIGRPVRPPEPAAAGAGSPVISAGEPRRLLIDDKADLRKQVNTLVRRAAKEFHAEESAIHAYLRRRDRGARVGEATAEQLARRKASLETWLRERFFPGSGGR